MSAAAWGSGEDIIDFGQLYTEHINAGSGQSLSKITKETNHLSIYKARQEIKHCCVN